MNDHAPRPFTSLTTKLSLPAEALRPFVWCYGQNTGIVLTSPVILPLPARPKNVLTFFLASGPARSLVAGPQTHQKVQISLAGNVDNFTIHFQPSGLHRLFGVEMRELPDAAHDAEAILGQNAIKLRTRLGETTSFVDRVRLTDSLLLRLTESVSSGDAVAAAANHVFAVHGKARVDALAAACGLSVRQFERRFRDNTGLPPKLFARITRFNASVFMKLCRPESNWTTIAIDCGFSDQMHLVRDFREFAGDTPSGFDAKARLAPELRSMFATEDFGSGHQSGRELSHLFY